MRTFFASFVIFVALIAGPGNAAGSNFEPVRLAELMAAPEKFVGRDVQLHGFLILRFEGTSLWPDRDAFLNQEYEKAVWVNFDYAEFETDSDVAAAFDRLSGRTVFINGQISASGGHLGLWPATIEQIGPIRPDPADTAPPRPSQQYPTMVALVTLLAFSALTVPLLLLGWRNFERSRT